MATYFLLVCFFYDDYYCYLKSDSMIFCIIVLKDDIKNKENCLIGISNLNCIRFKRNYKYDKKRYIIYYKFYELFLI